MEKTEQHITTKGWTNRPLRIWGNVYSANNYLFKDNNRNTRKRCEICSKLTTKTPERLHWVLWFKGNYFDIYMVKISNAKRGNMFFSSQHLLFPSLQ